MISIIEYDPTICDLPSETIISGLASTLDNLLKPAIILHFRTHSELELLKSLNVPFYTNKDWETKSHGLYTIEWKCFDIDPLESDSHIKEMMSLMINAEANIIRCILER